MTFWIVQALGILSLLFYAISLQQKSQTKLLAYSIAGDAVFAAQYCFSDTKTGAIAFIISIAFCLVAALLYNGKKLPLPILFIFEAIMLGASVYTWQDYWSIVPILMSTVHYVRVWYGNVDFSRYAALVLTVGWTVYSIVTGNYGGAVTQGVIFVAAVVGIVRGKKA